MSDNKIVNNIFYFLNISMLLFFFIFFPTIWFTQDKPKWEASNGFLLDCKIANVNPYIREIIYFYQNCTENYHFQILTQNDFDFYQPNVNDTIPCRGLVYVNDPNYCENYFTIYPTKKINYVSILYLTIITSIIGFVILCFILFILFKRLNN